MSNPVILILGAGPGLGASVARRFGSAGYDVALMARDEGRLEQLGNTLQAEGITTGWTAVDLADEEALAMAVQRFAGHAGQIDVLHFNPSTWRERDPLTLTPAELAEDLTLGVSPLLTAVQAARPHLVAGSRVIATGSSAADRPNPSAASLGVQKAALRNLVRSLDLVLAPEDIRAASLTVDGVLGRPRFTHAEVADALFALASRSADQWTSHESYSG